ncbi:MAG: TetR/AcrR family transcriptional regulator [Acidimicrobiales bacterium]|nr:TetR/AcrR family transcriptional regulator [Acidimicrobiales bacterium]
MSPHTLHENEAKSQFGDILDRFDVTSQKDHGTAPSNAIHLEKIVDGALVCIARYGLSKTGVEDIAKESKCSRATVYRVFPGGKESIIEAVVATEVGRLFRSISLRLDGVDTLEDALVAMVHEAGVRLLAHEALSAVVTLEPSLILPHLAFDRMSDLLDLASDLGAPMLERWLPLETGGRVAEWIARIVISYSASPAENVNVTDEDSVRSLVATFVMPGIEVLLKGRTSFASNDS